MSVYMAVMAGTAANECRPKPPILPDSNIPMTRSQASTRNLFVCASSADISISPCMVDTPTTPKKPVEMRPRPASTSPIGPTSDPDDRRSKPPGTRTLADDCSMNSVATRRALVTTTRLRRSRISWAR